MIEFQGDIKNSIKREFFARQVRMFVYLLFSSLFVGCTPLLIYLSAKFNEWRILGIDIGILFLGFLGCFMLTKRKAPQKKELDTFCFPTSVRISNEGLALHGKGFDQTRNMADVKKVYDYGEYYFITFYFKYRKRN